MLMQQFLIDLVILIAIFTTFVLATVLWKPRIWLHDFPADIQAMAPPKTEEEKRLTIILGVPFVALFFVLPILLGWDLKPLMGPDYSFIAAWGYGYGLFFFVNLWDLVVLDWVGFALIDPQNPPIPSTEGAKGYRDYAFHFYAFLKGCLMGLVFATVFAVIITFLS